MKYFLSAKHWQLFISIMAPQLALEFDFINTSIVLKIICIIIGFGTFFGWIWVVSTYLNDKFKNSNLKIERLKTALLLFVIYLPIQFILLKHFPEIKYWMLIPNTLFLVLAIYTIAFCAKLLKTVELGEEADISKYFFDFIKILFFPLGIWSLQKRVNYLYHTKNTEGQN